MPSIVSRRLMSALAVAAVVWASLGSWKQTHPGHGLQVSVYAGCCLWATSTASSKIAQCETKMPSMVSPKANFSTGDCCYIMGLVGHLQKNPSSRSPPMILVSKFLPVGHQHNKYFESTLCFGPFHPRCLSVCTSIQAFAAVLWATLGLWEMIPPTDCLPVILILSYCICNICTIIILKEHMESDRAIHGVSLCAFCSGPCCCCVGHFGHLETKPIVVMASQKA